MVAGWHGPFHKIRVARDFDGLLCYHMKTLPGLNYLGVRQGSVLTSIIKTGGDFLPYSLVQISVVFSAICLVHQICKLSVVFTCLFLGLRAHCHKAVHHIIALTSGLFLNARCHQRRFCETTPHFAERGNWSPVDTLSLLRLTVRPSAWHPNGVIQYLETRRVVSSWFYFPCGSWKKTQFSLSMQAPWMNSIS